MSPTQLRQLLEETHHDVSQDPAFDSVLVGAVYGAVRAARTVEKQALCQHPRTHQVNQHWIECSACHKTVGRVDP